MLVKIELSCLNGLVESWRILLSQREREEREREREERGREREEREREERERYLSLSLSLSFFLSLLHTHKHPLSFSVSLSTIPSFFLISWRFCSRHFLSGCRGDGFHSWICRGPSPIPSLPDCMPHCPHTHSSTTQQTDWPNPPKFTAVHTHSRIPQCIITLQHALLLCMSINHFKCS